MQTLKKNCDLCNGTGKFLNDLCPECDGESYWEMNKKLWYSDNGENGILFTVFKFDKDLKCDECQEIGAWYMINEKYKIGACDRHANFEGNIGEGKLWSKMELTSSDSLDGINPSWHK